MKNVILYFFENIEGGQKSFCFDSTKTESFFVHFNIAMAENKKENFLQSEIVKKSKELKINSGVLVIQISHVAGHEYIRCPVKNSKINFKKFAKEKHGINGGKTI